MFKAFNFSEIVPQTINGIRIFSKTIPFIMEHKLWSGFMKHGWIALFSLFVSVLFSYYAISDFWHWLTAQPAMTLALSGAELQELSQSAIEDTGKASFNSGGIKYLLLMLLEVVIFYFSIKTLAALTGVARKFTISDFIRAEKRMIRVLITNYIYALIIHLLLKISLSILGVSSAVPVVMFFVYAYFLGYAFLDNYYEQFGESIADSRTRIEQQVGAALAFGIVASVAMLIPVLGPLFAPVVLGVAATLYGEEYGGQLSVRVQE